MLSTVAVRGYRSLRDIVLPLGQLTVVTGANGSGKSSVYRALRLLADCGRGEVIGSLAREGGLQSARWAGNPLWFGERARSPKSALIQAAASMSSLEGWSHTAVS
jgi:predicted ATPase